MEAVAKKMKEMKPLEDFGDVVELVGISSPARENVIEFVLTNKDGEKRYASAMGIRLEDFPDEGVPEIESLEVLAVGAGATVWVGDLLTIKDPDPGTVILTANFKRPARARLEALKLFVFAK